MSAHGRGSALCPLFFAWLSKLLMPSYLLEEALLKPRTPTLKFAIYMPPEYYSSPRTVRLRKRSPDQLWNLLSLLSRQGDPA
ncbi:hypothetical protein N431DRAFT_427815 [Stipitochalara longipes BDJ]|nr:hypothetical protein N431DRAFT_427815 [Stipitochalara longipes BDJ]